MVWEPPDSATRPRKLMASPPTPAAASVRGVREDAVHQVTETVAGCHRARQTLSLRDNCEHLAPILASVGSGTMKACAISSVVRPATAACKRLGELRVVGQRWVESG